MYLKGKIDIVFDDKCLISDILNSTHISPNQTKNPIKNRFSHKIKDISIVKINNS